MLSDPWSVGYVTSLIETKEWPSNLIIGVIP